MSDLDSLIYKLQPDRVKGKIAGKGGTASLLLFSNNKKTNEIHEKELESRGSGVENRTESKQKE